MKIKFNQAQLSRPQREKLEITLDVLQEQNENELEVTAVEFPNKLLVKLDDDFGVIIGWDNDKQIYAPIAKPSKQIIEELGIGGPETLPETETEHGTEVVEFKMELDNDGKVLSDSRLENSPVLIESEIGKRVQALAWELAKVSEPLDNLQRCEIWIQFTKTFLKELLG